MRRVILLLAVVMVVAAGCASTNYELTGGRIACDVGITYKINPAGFTQAQMNDIWIAAGMIGSDSNTKIRFGGYTTDDVPKENSATTYVLVEHKSTSVDGVPSAATSTPIANQAHQYYAGTMWFNPSADKLPVGPLNGLWGSTYLKLALHEWGHYAGLLTTRLDQPNEIMNPGASAPRLGSGDEAGLHANGC